MAGRHESDDRAKERGKKLGARIERARKAADMTRMDLAERSGVKIDTIKKIEDGEVASPSVFTIADLAIALEKEITEWVK